MIFRKKKEKKMTFRGFFKHKEVKRNFLWRSLKNMIDTKAYKTRAEIVERRMPRINGNNQHKGKTILAIDGGYSSVKIISPNKVATFPSYAKKAPSDLEIVGKIKPSDIQFRDNKTNEIWLVGESAQVLMNQSDINSTTDESLYTRYRYNSDIYKVIMSSGLALGLLGTGSGNDIYVQTGLPATYISDKNKLIDALAGDYDISIKIGNNDWSSFKFTLNRENIDVITQPQGTLCATAYENGEVSQHGKRILASNSIILDIGFGTEDTFAIRSGYKVAPATYTDTGMKSVFEGVIKELCSKYPAEFKIFEFQNFLETGEASYFDVDEFAVKQVNFADLLEAKNKELCEISIRRLLEKYDKLRDYKYLIVTGGTGESRYEQIKQMLTGLPHLTVLPGNINCSDLAFSYSNVYGYYMLRHAKLSAEMRKLEQ